MIGSADADELRAELDQAERELAEIRTRFSARMAAAREELDAVLARAERAERELEVANKERGAVGHKLGETRRELADAHATIRTLAGLGASPVHCTAAQPCEQTRPRRLVDEFSECRCGHERGFHGEGAGGPCHECEPCEQFRLAEHDPAPYVYDRPPASAEPIESLVERSSLGTPEARAARESVPEETALRDAEAAVEPDALRETHGRPRLSPAYETEDGEPVDWSVHWDWSFGCNVSIGYDDGELTATVNLSDLAAKRNGEKRRVTKQQVLDYAVLLTQLVDEPAPADRSEVPSREEVWKLIAGVRDEFPRHPKDVSTDHLIDALRGAGWLQVRDDEGGQE